MKIKKIRQEMQLCRNKIAKKAIDQITVNLLRVYKVWISLKKNWNKQILEFRFKINSNKIKKLFNNRKPTFNIKVKKFFYKIKSKMI